MIRENKSIAEFSPAGLSGLAISREAWLAHIDNDSELRVEHEDDQLVIASWKDRKSIFCFRHGVVTPQCVDRDAMNKLEIIASSDSGLESARRKSRRRKVIPRAKAAAFVSVAGLLATAVGKAWLDYLFPAAVLLEQPPIWLSFLARSVYTTGIAAVFAAWILAVSSLFPFERRSALYAAAVFCAGVAVFLIM